LEITVLYKTTMKTTKHDTGHLLGTDLTCRVYVVAAVIIDDRGDDGQGQHAQKQNLLN